MILYIHNQFALYGVRYDTIGHWSALKLRTGNNPNIQMPVISQCC